MLYEQFTFREDLEMPGSVRVNVSAGGEDRVLLEGLQEFVEYSISIRAFNADGAGPYSHAVNATTYQDGNHIELCLHFSLQ